MRIERSDLISVKGAVLDTIKGLQDLNSISDDLTEHGVVIAVVNKNSRLHGLT